VLLVDYTDCINEITRIIHGMRNVHLEDEEDEEDDDDGKEDACEEDEKEVLEKGEAEKAEELEDVKEHAEDKDDVLDDCSCNVMASSIVIDNNRQYSESTTASPYTFQR
jgi:hypothetical protein